MKSGDALTIPREKDLVILYAANTNIMDLIDDETIVEGKINVAYSPGRSANYYVRKYMGGDNKQGRKGKITVTYPNGKFKKTIGFFPFRIYPPVEKGCTVHVGTKTPKAKKPDAPKEAVVTAKKDRPEVDWGRFLRETIATTTATISLILLVRELNKE